MKAGYRFLWQFIRPWKLRLLLALSGLTVVSAASLLFPWLLKLMVDQYGGRRPTAVSIDVLMAALVAVFLLSTVAGYYQQIEMRKLGSRLRNEVRQAFYASLLAKPMQFHRQEQVGELTSRATEDIGRLQNFFSSFLSPAYQNGLFVGGCLLAMAFLNLAATLMVLFLAAIPIPFLYLTSRRVEALSARSQAIHARANGFLAETLVAMREIRAFVRETLELSRYTNLLKESLAAETELASQQVRANQIIYLLFSAALLAIFYTGTRSTFFPDWTLGDVIAFYFYSYTMTMALLSVGRVYLNYREFGGTLRRVADLLATPPQAKPRRGLSFGGPVTGRVTFQDVVFSYDPAKPVLRGVSLAVDPGEWLLITGPSGSGKSTLAGLLMGFYTPLRGTIAVDGIALGAWDISALRRQIGYVGQDPLLIQGSLRDNIVFADRRATDDQLDSAIRTSCLEEVICALPEGVETVVGERGYTLSAGQKARIAIARAVLHNPPVLLLDEANATLEEDLERRLWQNLTASRAGKTTIILSHHYRNIPEVYRDVRLAGGMILPISESGVYRS